MKRFTTEEEILEVIDTYHQEMLSLSFSADSKDQLADKLRDTEEAYRIEGLRQQSYKLRKQVLWREARLVTLGERLSVMRTPQLVGVDNGDTSIPIV